MGYSLSIVCASESQAEQLFRWLTANFRPYLKENPGVSVQRRPSYSPRKRTATGWDYSTTSTERAYLWRIARFIAGLAKAPLYYDNEMVETEEHPEKWADEILGNRLILPEDEPEELIALLKAEMKRLQEVWEAEPPIRN